MRNLPRVPGIMVAFTASWCFPAALGLVLASPSLPAPRYIVATGVAAPSGSCTGSCAEHKIEKSACAGSPVANPGSQYIRDKLRLDAVQRQACGNNISVALIDTAVDENHPDIRSAVVDHYEPTGSIDDPHVHGTGIVGAIVAQGRLLGVAPGAHILAVRAFPSHVDATGETTSYSILKGIEWAISNNVRVVNMSFVGPRDPSLQRALEEADRRGIALVAAVGNGGPNAQPLFPAADPHVIAVTATDAVDQLFAAANRGPHVAISAPGVDILAPAPGGAYQKVTGTSIAAAHVSGVIALLLERNPTLTPVAVRTILAASAKPLGAADQFGAGLVDPTGALEMAKLQMATAVMRSNVLN
jgi:subtilisin family serine protease